MTVPISTGRLGDTADTLADTVHAAALLKEAVDFLLVYLPAAETIPGGDIVTRARDAWSALPPRAGAA